MKKTKGMLLALAAVFVLIAGSPVEGNAAMQTNGTEKQERLQEIQIESVKVSEKNVEQGNNQQITVELTAPAAIQGAVLEYYHEETGESFRSFCSEMTEKTLSFELFFEGDARTGAYRLYAVTFETGEGQSAESLESMGEDAVFRVCAEGLQGEETGSWEETENTSFADIRSQTEKRASTYPQPVNSQIVIVLDPGHDSTHAGACQNGLNEEKLNLKIARYCKAELEEYQGVKVYLTRGEDGACPYPGRTSARCNEKRVEYAKSVDADFYISLHNNSSTSSQPKGAIVYYPNTNYRKSVSDTAKGLAKQIQNRLVSLGLYNNGISMKYSADYTYPDGSTADYYAVIRNSKLQGIPAIIVEHAYMTSSSDVQNFLSSDSKLKKLGVSDATAIAEYCGLSKEAKKPSENISAVLRPVETSAPTPKPAEGQVFLDVYEDWYTDYVKYVYEHEIMFGIGTTLKFAPLETITKAQVAQVLYNMEGNPWSADKKACTELKDVYEDWYTDAVCWAYSAGVVTGDLVTLKFSPDQPVKREELAMMLYRYAIYKGYSVKQTSDFSGLKNSYKVSSWALDGMRWAVGAKLISGIEVKNEAGKVTGYDLAPQGTASRAQMAAIMARFCTAYD